LRNRATEEAELKAAVGNIMLVKKKNYRKNTSENEITRNSSVRFFLYFFKALKAFTCYDQANGKRQGNNRK